jgi:hypothetical protein
MAKADRFTPWYTVGTAAVFLLIWVGDDLDRIYNLYLMLVPILFFPSLIWAGTLIVALIVSALRRHWRHALCVVAAPIIVWSLFIALGKLGITTKWVRLELSKSAYMAEVDALPVMSGGRLKSWSWGKTGGAAVVNVFWTLVYDESDQIVCPPSSRSAAWVSKAEKDKGLYSALRYHLDEPNYQVSIERLDGHFYVITEILQ